MLFLSTTPLIWDGYKNLSFTLKDESYNVIYENLLKDKDYNILFLDGAMLQLKYRFGHDAVSEHVLAFYPCPDFARYQDDPAYFDEQIYRSDSLFTEMLDEKILCAPLRFDYNADDAIHVDVNHPKSHLTIGNYKDCRIPLSAPLSPNRFVNFILRNFYFEKFNQHFSDGFFACPITLDSSITTNEKKQLHFSWS